MKTTQVLSFVLVGALSSGAVLARDPERGGRHGQRHEEMREWRQKMEDQLKAQDAELDRLVQQMDTASGPQKVDAVAAAVKALVQQRKTMQTQMESFRQRMQSEHAGQPESGTSPESSPGGTTSPGAPAPGAPAPGQ